MSTFVDRNSSSISVPRELVLISGKGGTGKTSLAASFAALAANVVLADCDVDAPDLHLLADPEVMRREPFVGGKRARIGPGFCTACGRCRDLCRFDAITPDGPGNFIFEHTFAVDATACEGCGVCARFCPAQAIEFIPVYAGEWFVSNSRFGTMVHAMLGAGAENSGKLVTLVRTTAREIAEEQGTELVLIDGAPGVGCAVTASLTGADMALVVTEPTASGQHDLKRVAELTRHFNIPTAVCINKWDLNPELAERIAADAESQGLSLAGRIRYDRAITDAQSCGKTIVEWREDGAAADICAVWKTVSAMLRDEADGAEPERDTSAAD